MATMIIHARMKSLETWKKSIQTTLEKNASAWIVFETYQGKDRERCYRPDNLAARWIWQIRSIPV